MAAERVRILDLSYTGLRDFVSSLGEPAFRADQVLKWVYQKLATSFAEMTDLSLPLRSKLESIAVISTLTLVDERISKDGKTRKALLRLPDGNTIETAYMAYRDNEGRERGTVCVSSQVGCAVECPFCATGQQGFVRNLTSGEIIEQALYFMRELTPKDQPDKKNESQRRPVTNVVFMGMGEPLANYDNVVAAVGMLTSPKGLNLSARQVTISTAGVVPRIRQLVDDGIRVELAVSLHAPTDELRGYLVPLGRTYPLSELMMAVRYFYQKTERRPTIEYALFRGVNDRPDQAQALAGLLRGLNAHVNLIAGNRTCDAFQPAGEKQVLAFRAELEKSGVLATIREPRGQDIEAGCGQLKSRSLDASEHNRETVNG
jgi:23S rRNA (adenine2503-C2)-methyltransferase